MPKFRRPPWFGGDDKSLNMYCIDACDVGPNLTYVPDVDGSTHGTMQPTRVMPFDEYQGFLADTVGEWNEVKP
jgi:hypothetical protein